MSEKNIENRTNETPKRRSSYNPNRACYLSSDGKYYCYEIWDSDACRMTTLKLEVGKDLSEEWTIFLDDTDHDEDLNDRYEDDLRDPLFTAKANSFEDDSHDEDAVSPWDTLPDRSSSPEDVLFAEEKSENPDEVRVREVIENDCTEQQQNLFFDHFGEEKQLEQIRQEEAEQTGKLPSSQAMTNRKNKIIDKAAKALGAERVKRHSSHKQD